VSLAGVVHSKGSGPPARAAVLLGSRSPGQCRHLREDFTGERETSYIEGMMNAHGQAAQRHLRLPDKSGKRRCLQGYERNKLINRPLLRVTITP